jgi:subtilisin family serine protease
MRLSCSLLAVASVLLSPLSSLAQTTEQLGIGHIVSSNSGPNAFSGLNINNVVGANTFYTAGFTGTRSIVANLEAGHIWNGHETLTHVNTFINGTGTVAAVSGNTAAMDRHATWAGHTIGGRSTSVGAQGYQRGIAYGSTLWSGSLATNWSGAPYSLSFNFNFAAMIEPYRTALVTGVAGQTADVVNSSWGFSGDSIGRSIFTRGVDSLVSQSGKIVVFSAGNTGPTSNTVGGPATGYNTWSIAALGSDTDATPYNTVSSFSSRGPNDVFIPNSSTGSTGTTIANARVKVDLAAPGQNLTLAYYGGATGGNAGGVADGGSNLYSINIAGTSFAAPIVAAGAALIVDVSKANGLTNGTDTRVVKTILQTTASKTAGWSNAQTLSGGVITTTQALDPNVGAGRMNLTSALPFVNSSAATRDVPGTTSGNLGIVSSFGWDFGIVQRLGQNEYFSNTNMPTGSTISVTLNWLARRALTGVDFNSLADNGLANLDLEVWRIIDGIFTTRVARSSSLYNNTEHLFFQTPSDGLYGIRVTYASDVYRFDGNTSEIYGISWLYSPVPEPSTYFIVVVGIILFVSVQRRLLRGELGF